MPPPFVSGGRYVNETARGAADAVANVIDAKEVKAPAPAQRSNALLLDSPLRSGQYIENLDGDVIVVGSVASGAEIVAGGSIHVYGALRGRRHRGGRPTPRAHLLPQARSRIAGDRWPLHDSRRHGGAAARTLRSGLLNGDSLVITAQD